MRADLEQEYVEYVTARLPLLRRIACQLTGDPHRGDDLVQTAVTRLYVNWRRAREAQNLDAYVRTVLVRVFLDEKRRLWSRVRLTDTPPEPTATPIGDAVEDRELLHAALAQVPPRQRAVLVLRFLHDRPVDEVAATLGCTAGTVKSQTSQGLARLRRLLGAADYVITGEGR
ncbi:SigE family RNA polymerase sigma factor [Micromonospora mirobrigensis]|uniref:RNA polymerase sigma-70 factor, sigma-E family n=1 Tax=Micromonospora mirobrigensis TaxID=262898 RepID=A0A1C4VKU3_9ACTN|nr:SigE family RNA polymerase sigma factor [Micromonospora mirobrigensis]SCE84622.1 RNA polymerase sigma-70 factor, sigma-E family [Micromonospora mirobrigensis]